MAIEHVRHWKIGDVEIARIVEVNNWEDDIAMLLPDGKPEYVQKFPWLVPNFATPAGRMLISFQCFVLRSRDCLVLKPSDDYGGAGIVLGWEVDDSAWETAVRAALTRPYIVQERIALPSEPYPSVVDGRVEIRDRLFDTAPFVAHGESVDGCLTRLSTAALLNVTAGGGSTVPTFVVEPR